MEKVQDNPEAKAAMEKAMAEFHRAMAESIKNAPKTPAGNFMKINPDQFQNFGGAQWQPLPGGDGKSFIWQAATKPGEGRLGIVIEKPNDVLVEQLDLPKGQGVIVVQVIKGSPAEKAGIKAKDVLLTLSGKAVSSEPGSAMKMIGGIKKDAKIDVVVIRKGQKETIKGIAIPEGKKVEVRRVEGKAGQGQLEFTLPKDAKIPDDIRKEIEKKIHDAHLQAQKEIERVQRDLPRIQDQARREVERAQREVERAARELPKMQGDLQKQIEQMKAELQKMEQQLNNKGGTTSRGQGEGGSKNKSSSSSMSVSTDGETFSIVATRDSVKYNIGGSLEDGKAVPNRITVKDGDKSYSGTIDKIPAKYRATVKSMLGNVGGGKK
jgi:membrane-associated protease RseP (regulator of RpoE activity)